MVTTETAITYAAEYLAICAEIKRLEKRKELLAEKLVKNYGTSVSGEHIGKKYKISTWVQVTPYIDSARLKVEFPDIYQEFRKESKPFQQIRITVQK